MTINEIKKDYNDKKYDFQLTVPRLLKVSSNHIFDENLSVKRNREMAEEHNRSVTMQTKMIFAEKNRLFNLLRDNCISAIVEESCFINTEMATEIFDVIYSEHHDTMNDFFWYMEEAIDFIDRMINKFNENPKRN